MNVHIQYVKMPVSESMSQYTEEKLQKLARKYEWVITANVHFKQEPDPAGGGKICEMELSLPGPKIFATSKEKNWEMAVKETLSDVERQLKKRKATFNAH